MAGKNNARGLLQQDNDGSQFVRTEQMKTYRRFTDGNFIYICTTAALQDKDNPVLTSDPIWQIEKRTYLDGFEVLREFALSPDAPGQALYDRICDDRTTFFTPATPTGTGLDLPDGDSDVIWTTPDLSNGTFGIEMNQIGTPGTPIDFTFAPGTGETFFLHHVALAIVDMGSMNPDVFGSLAIALANGLQLQVRSKGVTREFLNVKDNLQIMTKFPREDFTNPSRTGFMNNEDIYMGLVVFDRNQIRIQDSTSDFVRLRVRDDLTGVQFLRAGVHLWRPI